MEFHSQCRLIPLTHSVPFLGRIFPCPCSLWKAQGKHAAFSFVVRALDSLVLLWHSPFLPCCSLANTSPCTTPHLSCDLSIPSKAQKLTLCFIARIVLSCTHVLIPGAQAKGRPELGHVDLCCQLTAPVPDLQGENQQGSWLKGNRLQANSP